jgi:UTP--glucose-1-phosphate uridylyltransferase
MPKTQIKKAVIPAAGFGTRLFPATKVVKKELFPIIDQDGRVKPVIQLIVEEAINAGIEEIGIVIQPEDKRVFVDLFKYPPKAELFEKLSPENQKHSKHIVDLGDRIKFLSQKEQAGYGHAVYCAKEWVNDQPFLLMLGDHIYASDIKKSCARQVLEVFAQANQSVVGLTTISADMIHKAGCVTGVWQKPDSILSLRQVYEKPTVEYARQHLRVEGISENEFLSIFGLYALTPIIFNFLEENINNQFRERGEFQLTTCLEQVRQQEGMTGYIVQGKSFDIGIPDVYLQTLIDFRNR